MKKVSIFWKKDSSELVSLLDDIKNDSRVQTIPALKQSGEGEEILTNDVAWLEKEASKFNCRLESW